MSYKERQEQEQIQQAQLASKINEETANAEAQRAKAEAA